MTKNIENILAVLLDVKKKIGLKIDEKLIIECYELQKKYQFDPARPTVEKMRVLVENLLNEEIEEQAQ